MNSQNTSFENVDGIIDLPLLDSDPKYKKPLNIWLENYFWNDPSKDDTRYIQSRHVPECLNTGISNLSRQYKYSMATVEKCLIEHGASLISTNKMINEIKELVAQIIFENQSDWSRESIRSVQAFHFVDISKHQVKYPCIEWASNAINGRSVYLGIDKSDLAFIAMLSSLKTYEGEGLNPSIVPKIDLNLKNFDTWLNCRHALVKGVMNGEYDTI